MHLVHNTSTRRLRDGRTIHTVTALLLQLVQTSSHNVRTEARRIARARQQQTALRRQDSTTNAVEPFLDDQDMEVSKPLEVMQQVI